MLLGILLWAKEESYKYELPAEAQDRLPKTEGVELDIITDGNVLGGDLGNRCLWLSLVGCSCSPEN